MIFRMEEGTSPERTPYYTLYMNKTLFDGDKYDRENEG